MKDVRKLFKVTIVVLLLICFYLMSLVGSKNEEIRFKEKQIKTLRKMIRKIGKITNGGI